MSATADRLRDAAQIVDSIHANVDSAPGAIDHALALIKIADRDLTLQLERLRAEIEQREAHRRRYADSLTPATRAALFGPGAIKSPSEEMRRHGSAIGDTGLSPGSASADQLRELNAAISASTAGLESASNPHPRRSV